MYSSYVSHIAQLILIAYCSFIFSHLSPVLCEFLSLSSDIWYCDFIFVVGAGAKVGVSRTAAAAAEVVAIVVVVALVAVVVVGVVWF